MTVAPIARGLGLLLALLAAAFAAALATAAEPTRPTEQARIEALIGAVGRLQGAVFIRNGSEHTAAEAASHLRLKWKNAGRRVRSAEDFIRVCATESSITGRKYVIRFASGREVEAADYLRIELWRFDAAARLKPAPAPASTPG